MTLFDMKKEAIENAVRRHSKEKGLDPPPSVSITENPCPFSAGEIAHIHIEERIICIWKKKLEELTLDQINKVAAHEVAHLISIEHGGEHAQAQAEIEIADWGRSVGGVVIHGGKEVAPSVPDKPIKPGRRKKICSYHSCNKRTELVWCPYCERFFCKEHLRPKSPTLPPFKQKGIVGRIYMGEWRGAGHACPPYFDYLKTKKKEDLQKQREALNTMRGLPPVPVSRRPIEIYYEKPKSREIVSEKPKSREITKYIIGFIVVVVIIWVLLYLFKIKFF